MPDELVRRHLRQAISSGPANLSLTATMFSRAGEFTRTGMDDDPVLFIRTGAAAQPPAGPLRLIAVENERPLPDVKHVGEAIKTLYLRHAVEQGYDDAAFVDSQGRISEATIWNLAFWDGNSIIWPRASVLPGITMTVIRRQLDGLGVSQREEAVPLRDAGDLAGAAAMNSWTPGIGVTAIGATPIQSSPALTEILHEAYRREPMTEV